MNTILDKLKEHQQIYNLSNHKMAVKMGISRGTYDYNLKRSDKPFTSSFIRGVLVAFPEYEKYLIKDLQTGSNNVK